MNRVKELCLYALLASILVVSKEVLAFLPNIELVTLLLIIYAINLNLSDTILISIIYSTIECLLYGFTIYSFGYYLVWVIIVLISFIFLRFANVYKIAFFSLFFGLGFDLIFSIPFFIISLNTGLAYLTNGVLFSLVHGIFNFIIALCLFESLDRNFKRFLRKYQNVVK